MAVLSLASVRLLPETPALAPCILPILDFSTAHAYIKNPPNLSPLPSRIFLSDRLLENEKMSRVGGYPPWVQFRDETPNCPICETRAEFVGAIGSEDTNLIWGDSGYWYFFACKATPECHGLDRPLMASQCY
jgi:hypothetical protein